MTKDNSKDYKAGVATALGASGAAAGVGMKTAGFYTLKHSVTGATMLASTLGGASVNVCNGVTMKITNVVRYAILLASIFVLGACDTTSSIPYKASTQNIMTIQDSLSEDDKVGLSSVSYSAGYKPDLLCRLLGDVDVGNGLSIPEYIKSAFEEELFAAGRLDYNSQAQIEMKVEHVKFSTVSPAYWEISLKVSSNNDSGYSITSKSQFSTSFNAYSACKNASAAFGPAVQSALKEVVSHPNFVRLMN